MTEGQGKFCPACKRRNANDAVVCFYCGIPFEVVKQENATTTHMPTGEMEKASVQPADDVDAKLRNVPEEGIAFFLPDTPKPFDVRTDSSFIIGRKMDDDLERMIDLIPFNAFSMGVSRHHARVQHTDKGYEITDLGSTNGTWVNDKRLTPNKPYLVPSGSLLRLGRMRLYVIYRSS